MISIWQEFIKIEKQILSHLKHLRGEELALCWCRRLCDGDRHLFKKVDWSLSGCL